MLKSTLLHPQVMRALAESGHTTRILIADGNFPFNGLANPAAERVYLNYMPGMLSATDVLKGLLTAIPIEAAHVTMTSDGTAPDIHAEFQRLLPDIQIQAHAALDFYELLKDPALTLVIATAEERLYANLLLVVGVVPPSS